MSRRRIRLRRNKRTPYGKIALGIGAALIIALSATTVIGAVSVYTLFKSWLADLPDYTSANAFELTQPTRIYSADGVLLAKLYLQNREIVAMSQIATDLAEATVAVEDERFYKHGGVSEVDPLD